MATVRRFDRGTLRKPSKDPRGALHVDGYATRVGVFEYADGRGGIRRELRLPEEVYAKKHLDSYRGAPMTFLHPNEWVTPDNSKRLQVGTVLDAGRRDDPFITIASTISDADAMKKIDEGVQELSVGYSVDLEEQPGVHPEFGKYDAIQRNLVVNHVAIVPRGRAGREARLRVDEAEMITEPAKLDDIIAALETPRGRAVIAAALRGDAELSSEARNNLAGGEFAVPGSRSLPIHDEAYVRAAMARFGQTHFADAAEKRSAYHKILAAAKRHGIDSTNFEKEWSGRLDSRPSTTYRTDGDPMNTEEIEALKRAMAAEKTRADELAKRLKDETKRADDAEGQVRSLDDEVKKLRAERVDASKLGALEAQVAELTKDIESEKKLRRDATAPAVIHKMVTDRLEIVRAALEVDPEMRTDDLSNREIQAKTLELIDGSKTDKDDSDDFVNGRFTRAVEARRAYARNLPRATHDRAPAAPPASAGGQRADEPVKPKKLSDAWKEPLPNSSEARAARATR